MKKIKLILLQCIVLFGQQRGVVAGRVLDSASQKPLRDASIQVDRLEDNSRIGFSVSNVNGWFNLLNIPLRDSLVVQVSYAGHESYRGLLVLSEKRLTLDALYLAPGSKQLDEVVVQARPPLMVIKKDTIEFNAALFKTLPNVMAEDLLNKIPGLIIDDQGRLVFNGRPVNKILVDGKVFFNTDGQVAMKNIPVDLIKKVQIRVDEPTLREPANSIGAQKTQTLNIRLKEGNKFFGNARAAAGTDSRYDLAGLVTRSNEREQLSVLGGWNNVNKMGPVSGDASRLSSGRLRR